MTATSSRTPLMTITSSTPFRYAIGLGNAWAQRARAS
jgi:hypothetical protein